MSFHTWWFHSDCRRPSRSSGGCCGIESKAGRWRYLSWARSLWINSSRFGCEPYIFFLVRLCIFWRRVTKPGMMASKSSPCDLCGISASVRLLIGWEHCLSSSDNDKVSFGSSNMMLINNLFQVKKYPYLSCGHTGLKITKARNFAIVRNNRIGEPLITNLYFGANGLRAYQRDKTDNFLGLYGTKPEPLDDVGDLASNYGIWIYSCTSRMGTYNVVKEASELVHVQARVKNNMQEYLLLVAHMRVKNTIDHI